MKALNRDMGRFQALRMDWVPLGTKTAWRAF